MTARLTKAFSTSQLMLMSSFLMPKELVIICMRTGSGKYEKKMTLKEIAEFFGVTSVRISHIESRAKRKLRHPRFPDDIRFNEYVR